MNVTRRKFVSGVTLAGAAGLLGVGAETAEAEPPPETTTLRLDQRASLCAAPPVRCARPAAR
jgi:NitT/TauT family transport system substrate-binding protein